MRQTPTHQCVQCGQPDSFARHAPHWCFACTACLATELDAADKPLLWHVTKSPKQRLTEIVLGEFLDAEPEDPEWPCDWWTEGRYILARYRRISHPDTPAYVELRWSPGKGYQLAKRGYPPSASLAEVDKADKFLRDALALPYRLSKAGAPSRIQFDTRDEMVAAVATAVRGLREKHRRVTQATVARYFNEHPGFPSDDSDGRNLRRWLKHKNWFGNWDELLEAALATLPDQ